VIKYITTSNRLKIEAVIKQMGRLKNKDSSTLGAPLLGNLKIKAVEREQSNFRPRKKPSMRAA